MLRIPVIAGLLALSLAGTAQARCRVVLESGEYRLGKTAKGWELCGRGVTFPRTGRPVALRSRGDFVTARFRERRQTVIRTVEFRDTPFGVYAYEDFTVLGAGERFVRQAFGEDRLYVAVGGRRPHIRALGLHPTGVVDRHRGVVPRSLRRRGDTLQWRVAGERRRVSAADGRDLPPADCRVPAYAVERRRSGGAVAYELRLGVRDSYQGTVFGCFAGGPPRKVAEVGSDLVIERVRARLLGGPFAVFEHTVSWKDTGSALFAVDLRTGTTTARAPLTGGFMETVVSPSGALGFSQRVAERQEIVTARGETVETLDRGPSVDGRSLKLDGTTLSWISGAQRRTTELP